MKSLSYLYGGNKIVKWVTIGKKIEVVLREWGLKNISTITVDNASSNDTVVGHIIDK